MPPPIQAGVLANPTSSPTTTCIWIQQLPLPLPCSRTLKHLYQSTQILKNLEPKITVNSDQQMIMKDFTLAEYNEGLGFHDHFPSEIYLQCEIF
jgi:hypothetical protein